MKRVLVTGAEGFAATHLIEALSGKFRITGTYFQKEPEKAESIFLDITDCEEVERAVSSIKPDIIFHLAAQASGWLSFSNPMLTHSVNYGGTLNLLESARKHAPKAAIVIPTSADIYGFPEYLPVDEDHPIKPLNPYAASKAAVHFLCKSYGETYGMRIVEARSFNHIGRGQSDNFFIPGTIAQIKSIKGKKGKIKLGNLNLERDFSDVRDIADAYIKLAGAESGVYNVCSGKPYRLEDLVKKIIEISGKEITVETDPKRLRGAEPEVFYGSNEKIFSETGWKPKRSIYKALEWIYGKE